MKPGNLLTSKVPNPASKSKDEERPISTAQSFRLGGFRSSRTRPNKTARVNCEKFCASKRRDFAGILCVFQERATN